MRSDPVVDESIFSTTLLIMKTLHLPHFEESSQSPYCEILRSLPGVNEVLVGDLFPAYRNRWQLVFNYWPRLLRYAWSAMRSAPKDTDVVVAHSHLTLLPFLLFRWTGFKPKLVLMGFIYTRRASPIARVVRKAYFRAVLARISLAVTHSRAEVGNYSSTFSLPADRFAFIPVSVHIRELDSYRVVQGEAIVSAGRSNRDYATLLEVAGRLNVPVKIICDSFSQEGRIPENVEVLRDCHHEAYLREIAEARCVVIPLKEEGESSGHMVLLHAMMFGKAVVVTGTQEMLDYVQHGETALTAARGSCSSLAKQITRLLDNPGLAQELGCAASARFHGRYDLRAGLSALVAVIESRLQPRGD